MIELFSLSYTAETLLANIDWKSPFLKGVGHFGPKFHRRIRPRPTICAQIDRPVNVLQLCC